MCCKDFLFCLHSDKPQHWGVSLCGTREWLRLGVLKHHRKCWFHITKAPNCALCKFRKRQIFSRCCADCSTQDEELCVLHNSNNMPVYLMSVKEPIFAAAHTSSSDSIFSVWTHLIERRPWKAPVGRKQVFQWNHGVYTLCTIRVQVPKGTRNFLQQLWEKLRLPFLRFFLFWM